MLDTKKYGLTDAGFQKILDEMAGDGTTYFTANQLYSHYISIGGFLFDLKGKMKWVAFISLVAIINPFFIRTNNMYWDVASVAIFAIAMAIIFGAVKPSKVTREQFEGFLGAWIRKSPIPNLITKTTLHEPPPSVEEEDIYEYGVEGVIIVDQDLYVDLFVLNGYQSEWKSVIISQTGYPSYLTEKVQKIIKENPSIKISYLHDAATSVDSMKRKVRAFLTLPSTVEELDMGVSEGDIDKSTVFKERQDEPGGIKLDFMPPKSLAYTMGVALVGGILLSEALTQYQSRSNSVSDFG